MSRHKPSRGRLTLRFAVIMDLERPDAIWRFAPAMNSHKGPVAKALLGLIVWPLSQQGAPSSMRRDKIYMQIASARRGQRDLGLDMLQETDVGALGAQLELYETFGWNLFIHLGRPDFAGVLDWYSSPLLGHENHSGRIHEPVAKGMRDVAAHGVGSPVFGD